MSSYTQISCCPQCGAPVYVPTAWSAVIPPQPRYSCNCIRRNSNMPKEPKIWPPVRYKEQGDFKTSIFKFGSHNQFIMGK